ncbi:protein aveugle isoform X3 [Bradysia coprophila]|uniref:protein aveugle isoform X3 n=1 Tax=Bradysia coprophila TaxID=38358 RepID=UPI00187D85DD|nr:protein aveugle isoform X3 [Bradysia coprophila]
MVEEVLTTNSKPKTTLTTRPKPVYLWSVADVQKWFSRLCGEYNNYSQNFVNHDITGRALLRMTDNSLLRMGIENNREREAIWREIVKLRLKTDIMEIKDFNVMNIYYE